MGGGYPLLSPVAFGKPARSNETLSLRTLLFHAPEYDSLNSRALPSPRGLPDAPQVGVVSSRFGVVSRQVWRPPKSVAPPPFGPSPREGKGRVFL